MVSASNPRMKLYRRSGGGSKRRGVDKPRSSNASPRRKRGRRGYRRPVGKDRDGERRGIPTDAAGRLERRGHGRARLLLPDFLSQLSRSLAAWIGAARDQGGNACVGHGAGAGFGPGISTVLFAARPSDRVGGRSLEPPQHHRDRSRLLELDDDGDGLGRERLATGADAFPDGGGRGVWNRAVE